MKILVIDDNVTFLDKMRKLLMLDQHSIDIATSGENSLLILNEKEYDLILMDLKMPGLCGGDLIRKIKEIGVNSIIIVITGYGTINTAVETIKAGAYDYLLKPFDIPKLKKKIEEVESEIKLIKETSSSQITEKSEVGESSQKTLDLANLYHLLCLFKSNGITIYHHSFLDQKVEGSLIGGFISAIDSFQYVLRKWITEEVPSQKSLKSEDNNGKEWEINYQNFKIFVFERKYLNFVLILDKSPSKSLKNVIKNFSREVESKYATELEDCTGNIEQFQPIKLLVQKYFE